MCVREREREEERERGRDREGETERLVRLFKYALTETKLATRNVITILLKGVEVGETGLKSKEWAKRVTPRRRTALHKVRH